MKSVIDYKDHFIKTTEYAAIACSQLRGCGDKNQADQAAVNAMRVTLMNSPINSKIAIGEGEIDKAPMLYIGEKLGMNIDDDNTPALDIAVDPLECTRNCANNSPNAMTVMAIAPRGKLFSAPDTYMNKLVTNKNFKDVVSLEFSIEKNIENIASKSGRMNSQIKAIVLDRPRNQYIVDSLSSLNVQVEMISDGDVAASLKVASEAADIYMGIGSAPEGVIAATAVKGLGGYFDGKLHFHSEEARDRAKEMSNISVDEIIDINKLCVSTNSIFVATGVCDGWIDGVKIDKDRAYTNTVLVDVDKLKIHKITNCHSIKDVNKYIMEGVE